MVFLSLLVIARPYPCLTYDLHPLPFALKKGEVEPLGTTEPNSGYRVDNAGDEPIIVRTVFAGDTKESAMTIDGEAFLDFHSHTGRFTVQAADLTVGTWQRIYVEKPAGPGEKHNKITVTSKIPPIGMQFLQNSELRISRIGSSANYEIVNLGPKALEYETDDKDYGEGWHAIGKFKSRLLQSKSGDIKIRSLNASVFINFVGFHKKG